MRLLLLCYALTFLQAIAHAQQIDYDLPARLEKDINKDDYKQIVDKSVAIVVKRYTIDHVADGAIELKKGQEITTMNLDNLVRKCTAAKDKAGWDEIIRTHFDNIFASMDEQKKIDPQNYETVKKYLGIRIYPAETVNQRGGIASLIARQDLEGTYSLLMMDLPGAFTPVSAKVFDLWKKDTAEVFREALANIDRQKIEKDAKNITFDGSNIEVCFIGNEDYAASYALNLVNNSPELVGEWGSAVAIPNKGMVVLCKISKDKPVDFVKFIQMTRPVTEKYYQEHPQPISDQYFWYYKGKFTRITVLTDEKGNINVISPMGLTELMTKK